MQQESRVLGHNFARAYLAAGAGPGTAALPRMAGTNCLKRVDTILSPAVQSVLLARPAPWRPLVAVLPFAPGSDDPALRRLGCELADRLRDRLAADPATGAILISSDFLANAPAHALELICRELRVGHVITGKCHGPGDAPSLYVELTDTREWYVHWATFQRGTARSLLDEHGDPMNALVAELRCALAENPPR
jgi:TolB-like protein